VTAAAACAGALGTALLLPARSRWMLLAGLVLLGAAAVVLTAAFLEELGGLGEASVSLSAGLVVAIVVAAVALGALAALFVRHPALPLPLLLLAAPLRPPLDPDPTAPLFFAIRPDALVGYHLPLYAVLAASALALAWRALRGEDLPPIDRRLAYPATALIALTSLSLLWSDDRETAINDVLLYWLPSAALVAVIAHSPIRTWTPRALGYAAVGIGCVFAAVGIGQAIAGQVFFSTAALAQANATTDLFRTTSLFQDPSIYGRHLVVAMAVVLVALWLTRLRLAAGFAALVLLAVALVLTYSQSSMIALAAVALGIALVAGDRGARKVMAALVAAAAVAAVGALGLAVASGSAADITRNRSGLVVDTAAVFVNHPLVGVGVGSQPVATREEAETRTSLGRSSSHTTPLTVAAELGLLGLAAYLALLGGAVLLLRGLHRRQPALAVGLAAVLVVLFVHALIYEGFFETALSFGAIATACAALRASSEKGGRK
jgi:O-antigen ligase